MIKKKTILNFFVYLIWIAFGSGLTLLLVGAVQQEQVKHCSGLLVEFTDNHDFRMLDEAEVVASLFPNVSGFSPVGKRLQHVNLFLLEKQLEKNPWVKKANLFFDHQHILHVTLEQRKPVARLFTPDGNSFYLDAALTILPVKSNDVVSLPVFTNFYPTPTGPTAADTLLLKRVIGLSSFILADAFWMAQIEEVHVKSDQGFELYTQVGDQSVQLGLRDDWSHLFAKLKLLYNKISEENGWGKYSSIDLQYKDQAVCVRKANLLSVQVSTIHPPPDTLQTMYNTENKQLINQ